MELVITLVTLGLFGDGEYLCKTCIVLGWEYLCYTCAVWNRLIPVPYLFCVEMVNTCVTPVLCGVGEYMCYTCAVQGW